MNSLSITTRHRLALALAGLLSMTAAALAGAPDGSLARFRWSNRVLLASAPSASDPALLRQRALFAAMRRGARERDLVLVEAVGATAEARALREAFDLDPAAFQAVLVGKDGGAKLRSGTPVGADRLFPTIDAMPMRQEEMRRP